VLPVESSFQNVSPPNETSEEMTMRASRRRGGSPVRNPAGELVCLTVYRRGAREVVRRLDGGERMAA
jgi:hypothetical protein